MPKTTPTSPPLVDTAQPVPLQFLPGSSSFPNSVQTATPPSAPPKGAVRVLALGDVVARPGRDAAAYAIRHFKTRYGANIILVNGENSAGGTGITPATTKELFAAGADCITTGNHVWRYRECYPLLASEPALLRPANFGEQTPGKGLTILSLSAGRIAILNLAGRVFMDAAECPFRTADEALATLPPDIHLIIVDFHAEATSEKRAMAHYLDGRVSVLFGTHTHVQTSDARISGQGTASLTDLGMCGTEETSVLGMAKEPVLARFLSGMPHPFRTTKGPGTVNGLLADIDTTTGKALALWLVRGAAPR